MARRRDAMQAGVEDSLRFPAPHPDSSSDSRRHRPSARPGSCRDRPAGAPARRDCARRSGRPSAGGSSDSPWRDSRAPARASSVGRTFVSRLAIELARTAGLEAELGLRALDVDRGMIDVQDIGREIAFAIDEARAASAGRPASGSTSSTLRSTMRMPPMTLKLAAVNAGGTGGGLRKVTSSTCRRSGGPSRSRRYSTKSMPFSGCAGSRRTPERRSSSHDTSAVCR